MLKEKFAQWAPEEVIQYYTELSAEDYSNNAAAIALEALRDLYLPTLEKLLQHHSMEYVWRALSKRVKNGSKVSLKEITIALCNHFGEAKVNRMRSKGNRKASLRRLAGELRSLSHALLNDPASFEVALKLDQQDAFQGVGFTTFPHLSLAALAEHLEEHIRRDTSAVNPIVGKPNEDTARRTYFVRRTSTYFAENLGGPLHETVAKLVLVLFDEEMDQNHVQRLVNKK